MEAPREGIGGSHLSTKQVPMRRWIWKVISVSSREPLLHSHPHIIAPHLPFGPHRVAKTRNSDSESFDKEEKKMELRSLFVKIL